MDRKSLIEKLKKQAETDFDIIVIGGGATGLGIAVDATTRGYKTVLLEQSDFAQATSSRSTKLIHGGVRYLAQGDVMLVMEALHERSRMYKNAPHLSSDQEFIIPVYTWWDVLKYTIGLKFYDLLSGRMSMGKSYFIGRKKTTINLPLVQDKRLKGGIIYHDGQFDDARYALALAQTCIEKGAVSLNYFRVTQLLKNSDGKVNGVKATDLESGVEFSLTAKAVINATGIFADSILRMDNTDADLTIRPSQGVHLVLDHAFLGSTSALMIPKTSDGRVLFAIPWYDKVVVGTTDTPINETSSEPKALDEEVQFILDTAGNYLVHPPKKSDILCVYAGLRPLAAPKGDRNTTKEISRRHKITVSPSGLISILGGKWTIYRRMAEDTVNKAEKVAGMEKHPCITKNLPVYGHSYYNPDDRLCIYGHHAADIRKMIEEEPALGNPLHPALPYCKAEIIWVCKHEMPLKLQDVLARRTRALILNAKASAEIAPQVVEIMAQELGKDSTWKMEQLNEYHKLLSYYLIDSK